MAKREAKNRPELQKLGMATTYFKFHLPPEKLTPNRDRRFAIELEKITNFGSFSVRHKRSRIGRNPKTGKEAQVPARRMIRFRPSQKLKHRINNPESPHTGQIKLAAQELVDYHGDAALAVAKERVELLERSGKRSEIDLALLVLTQVERLVKHL